MSEDDCNQVRFAWFIIGVIAGGLLAHVSWLIGIYRGLLR